MNYDATTIPEHYARARALAPQLAADWIAAARRVAPIPSEGAICDVGCGTGRFLSELSRAFEAPVIGIDRSRRMLAQTAAAARTTRICVADAARLPFRSGSLRLAWLSNVVHHVPDLGALAAALAEALVPGGFAVVRNYVREDLADVPYLAYFPEALAWSAQTLPSLAELTDAFTSAKLPPFAIERRLQAAALSYADYLEKIRLRAYSDLAAISDDAFHRGLERMQAALPVETTPPPQEPLHLLSFRR